MTSIPARPARGAAAAVLAVLLGTSACRSAPPEVEEFLLATAVGGDGGRGVGRPLPALRVKPLAPRGFLDRRELAWREGDVRAGAYRYRRWGEPPAEAVTRLLVDALRARGAFTQVDGSAARPIGPLTLAGELLALHEVTDESGSGAAGVAELELVLEFAEADSPTARRILRARHEVAAHDDSMAALVRALSEALGRVLDELAPAVEAAAAELAPAR